MLKKRDRGHGSGRPGAFSIAVRAIKGAGGFLPKGVPAWFKDLDTNGDGQVALAEWQMGGKKLAEFAQYGHRLVWWEKGILPRHISEPRLPEMQLAPSEPMGVMS